MQLGFSPNEDVRTPWSLRCATKCFESKRLRSEMRLWGGRKGLLHLVNDQGFWVARLGFLFFFIVVRLPFFGF